MRFKDYIEMFDPENDNPDDAVQYPKGKIVTGGRVIGPDLGQNRANRKGIPSNDAAARFLKSKGVGAYDYDADVEETPAQKFIDDVKAERERNIKKIMTQVFGEPPTPKGRR